MPEDSNLRSGETPAMAGAVSRSIPVIDAATRASRAGAVPPGSPGAGLPAEDAVHSAADRDRVASDSTVAPVTDRSHAAAGRERFAEGSWTRSIVIALGVLYVPALAPLFLGPLGECDHCVQTYFQYFPLVPGAIGFSAFDLGDGRVALSIALAAAAFALALWSLRRGGRVIRWFVCVAAMAWVFSQAMWFSLLLRM